MVKHNIFHLNVNHSRGFVPKGCTCSLFFSQHNINTVIVGSHMKSIFALSNLIKNIIKNEIDHIIAGILKEKLDIHVLKEDDILIFRVSYASELIREDKVRI